MDDEEWAFVAPYLARPPEVTGRQRYELREVFNDVRSIVQDRRTLAVDAATTPLATRGAAREQHPFSIPDRLPSATWRSVGGSASGVPLLVLRPAAVLDLGHAQVPRSRCQVLQRVSIRVAAQPPDAAGAAS